VEAGVERVEFLAGFVVEDEGFGVDAVGFGVAGGAGFAGGGDGAFGLGSVSGGFVGWAHSCEISPRDMVAGVVLGLAVLDYWKWLVGWELIYSEGT
jgi:hypothetical protein